MSSGGAAEASSLANRSRPVEKSQLPRRCPGSPRRLPSPTDGDTNQNALPVITLSQDVQASCCGPCRPALLASHKQLKEQTQHGQQCSQGSYCANMTGDASPVIQATRCNRLAGRASAPVRDAREPRPLVLQRADCPVAMCSRGSVCTSVLGSCATRLLWCARCQAAVGSIEKSRSASGRTQLFRMPRVATPGMGFVRFTVRPLPARGLTMAVFGAGVAVVTAALTLGGVFLFWSGSPTSSAPDDEDVTLAPATENPSSTATTPLVNQSTGNTATRAPGPGTASSPIVVTRVIDGDTVDVTGGDRVRLIGIDSPEKGQCGFTEAQQALASMVEGKAVKLIPGARTDTDRYGRLLRYIEIDGIDANLRMIQQGHAIARFDSLDGYGRHPRQDAYRSADAGTPPWGDCSASSESPAANTPNFFAPPPDTPGGSGGEVYYANCAEARRAGVTPIYRGQPGYRAALDGDGDGIACE